MVQQDVPTCGRCGGKREDLATSICRGCAGLESLDIIDNAAVEPGDVVEWDGREWIFDSYVAYHLVTLISHDGHVEKGIDVRNLTSVGGER